MKKDRQYNKFMLPSLLLAGFIVLLTNRSYAFVVVPAKVDSPIPIRTVVGSTLWPKFSWSSSPSSPYFSKVCERKPLRIATSLLLSTSPDSPNINDDHVKPLRIAIVGAGPSGLLLSHLLLRHNDVVDPVFNITMFDGRSDPRTKEAEERAYALGVGIRGRTAIRSGVDDDLWQAVKSRGFESERFQLQLFGGNLIIPLRSETDSQQQQQESNDMPLEPSVLTYQTALCAALMSELERRQYEDRDQLRVNFNTPVEKCDLKSMTLTIINNCDDESETNSTANASITDSFDLIVGCDGVNSVVRKEISHLHPNFEYNKEQLPGQFKVVRLDQHPPKVDPNSVSLILPKSGSTTAFVEPTSQDGECCILFAGNNSDDPILGETSNVTAVMEVLQKSFPQWESLADSIAEQLIKQSRPGQASSVTCSTYHYQNKAVLVGDAAHATGGVSGQGVNSALTDAYVLSECLISAEKSLVSDSNELADCLLKYSIRQVPEGKALYDLSFGPKPRGIKAVQWTFMNIRDTLFRGRWGIGRQPLQTRLTTSLTPFVDIRRDRDDFYDEPFSDATSSEQRLRHLHDLAMSTDLSTEA